MNQEANKTKRKCMCHRQREDARRMYDASCASLEALNKRRRELEAELDEIKKMGLFSSFISEIFLRGRSHSSIHSELWQVHREIQKEAMFGMNRACEMMSRFSVFQRWGIRIGKDAESNDPRVENICNFCGAEVEGYVHPSDETSPEGNQ